MRHCTHRHWSLVGCLLSLGAPACSDSGSGQTSTTSDGSSSTDGPTASESTSYSPPLTGTTTAAPTTTDIGGADGSGGTAGASTGDLPPIECPPVPDCNIPPPDAGPPLEWVNFESSLVTASGGERHRGRDMFYNPDETHWAMAKFAYGATDWDLSGEQVDLFLLSGCEGEWQPLGSVFTTNDGDHPTVDGVEDSGGRVFFEFPRPLPLGRHRVHMVVRGDGSYADTYIEVVEPGTPIILSDVDGTLTTFEWERLVDVLTNSIPDVNPGAPEALHALVDQGYRPMYLTARPEFLGNRTYDFIAERNLPPGIIHTTLTATGGLGAGAVEYKTGELEALASRGLVPAFVFGNTDSDAEAYDNAGIAPLDQRIFFQFEDPFGGRTIESYVDLIDEFEGLDPVCE